MALVTLAEVLNEAKKGKYAVGNFDCFNLEMVRGVLKAAQELKSPVILAYAEVFIPITKMKPYVAAVREMAAEVDVPVVLHTDHFTHIPKIKEAIDTGFTSVMIDSSDKSFEENVALTKTVVDMARSQGVSVESELGHVSGLDGMFDNDENVFTDADMAADFVAQTGIDALAVSIGNVHGIYKAEPRLRFDILKDIADATNIPLVLHGASGISDEDIRMAASLGITKVNYYTDLCWAASRAMEEKKGSHLYDLCTTMIDECYKVTYDKIKVLMNN